MADPHIITANRTDDGSVVYLRADRAWTASLAEARLFEDDSERDALIAWAADAQQRDVCDPYSFPVDVGPEGPVPRSTRERIRAGGPAPVLRQWGYAS